MRYLIRKEFGLTGSSITYLFTLTAFMAMIPNYPILVVTMIVSIGLIVYFQGARDARDIDYYAILPVPKRDIVKAKFLFVMCIQGLTMLLLIVLVAIRLACLGNATVYIENPMMNANIAYLGYTLVCFSMFNSFFLSTFYKNRCTFVKPTIFYFIALFICIGLFEAMHHLPALQMLNSPSQNMEQLVVLILGIVLYILLTWISYRVSVNAFEKADL